MTIVYRAIWQDSLADVTALTSAEFAKWITVKFGSLNDGPLRSEDHRTFTRGTGTIDIRTVTLAAEPEQRIGAVYRADLIETGPDSRWHTTVRAWEAPDEDGRWVAWTWIDIEVVSDLRLDQIDPAAPKLARKLLSRSSAPHIGATPLTTTTELAASNQAAEDLAAIISDPDRVIPIVLINAADRSVAVTDQYGTTLGDVCDSIWSAVAGIASTYVVDDSTAAELTRILGRDYGIWDGVMRFYQPGVDPADSRDSTRHRYFFANRYATSPRVARLISGGRLCPQSALRRPPSSYVDIKRRLDTAAHSTDAELLELADSALSDADAANRSLYADLTEQTETLEELSLDYAIALELIARLQHDNDQNARHIAYLQAQASTPDRFIAEPEASLPTSCGSPSEAADLARTHLSDRLIIPDEALRDLDDLDATVTATAWGQTAWYAFQALHAYAEARESGWDKGGFWEWCKLSGHPKAWRASKKKLAMRESESVTNREKFRQTREFTVPAEYSASGTLYMQAHMKISEGGGNLAPRIYFEPDPRRVAEPKTPVHKVLVGFYGPHKYTPNTKT